MSANALALEIVTGTDGHAVDGVRMPRAGRHLSVVPEPTAVAPQATPSHPVRLTRFGRLVRTGALVVLLSSVGSVLAGSFASAEGVDHEVTVRAGESLSVIAQRELPGVPVERGVAELQQANQLSNPGVTAGQRLVIPEL